MFKKSDEKQRSVKKKFRQDDGTDENLDIHRFKKLERDLKKINFNNA